MLFHLHALFDALFNIIPLGTDLDKIDPTLSRMYQELSWDEDAERSLEAVLERMPVLTRISAAKQLRDSAERAARGAGEERVTLDQFTRTSHANGASASPRVQASEGPA